MDQTFGENRYNDVSHENALKKTNEVMKKIVSTQIRWSALYILKNSHLTQKLYAQKEDRLESFSSHYFSSTTCS